MFSYHVHPAGIEPTSTVPKTATLSVELRVHTIHSNIKGVLDNLSVLLWKTVDKSGDMCIKDRSLK